MSVSALPGAWDVLPGTQAGAVPQTGPARRAFDIPTRAWDDTCAVTARDMQNTDLYTNLMYREVAPQAASGELALDNYTTERWGYGVADAATIDVDSAFRLSPLGAHLRGRQQLFTRTYVAAPNLTRGSALPGLESQLQQGMDTSQNRSCDVLSDPHQDRSFMPMVDCLRETVQEVKHIVEPWVRGGAATRPNTVPYRRGTSSDPYRRFDCPVGTPPYAPQPPQPPPPAPAAAPAPPVRRGS